MSGFVKPLRVQPTKGGYNVLYGKVIFLKVSKTVLETFLADLTPHTEVLPRKVRRSRKKPEVDDNILPTEDEIRMKAIQLVRAYTKEKKVFFHSAAVKEISPKERAFKHFMDAVDIIERHKVTYKKYIRAQIHGMKWMKNGKGDFPKPGQLSNEQAETRLLDYLRDVTETKSGRVVQIHLSKEDREMPLQRNHTYLGYAKKVKDGIATLNETLYVQELQLIRKGTVREWVKDHLEKVAID